MEYYVYILSSGKNGTLYTGITNNLVRRVFEHKNKLLDGFSKKYNINKLVYFEIFNNIEEAISREKNLKAWKRAWKIRLIEENNKDWKDLYEEIVK